MTKEVKFEFFKLCAEEQDYTSQQTEVYENNLDKGRIPEKARTAYREKPKLEEWYKEFIRNKFTYFSLLLSDVGSADLEMNRIFGDEAALWAPIVDQWRKQADREKIVYISRISQMPKDIVISYWYNNLPEFLEWAGLCEDKAQIQECFEPPPQNELEAIVHTQIVDRINERLSLRFLSMIAQRIYEESDYIQEFLRTIQTEFRCDLCDYLQVQEERVVLTSTTVDLQAMATRFPEKTEEQLRQELSENQSYRKAEGISGTILLWPGPNYPWFHVGSDNLGDDLRKSVWKQELYEELYHNSLKGGEGKIQNFWMFPIVIEDKLVGTFRVVNKQDENGNNLLSGGWPPSEKFQLCTIAHWFSRLWGTLLSLPEMQRPDLATMITEWSALVAEFRKQLDLSWIQDSVLSQVLTELKSIALSKVEKSPLECSLVIIDEKDMSSFLPVFKSHRINKKVSVRQISDLEDYCHEVTSGEAAFVFNQEGKFIRVANIGTSKISSGANSIAKATEHWTSLGFLVEGEQQSILIYLRGNKVAEYYHFERRGKWYMRYYVPTLEKITRMVSNISPHILKHVYEEALWLSYHQPGASIIIGGERLDEYFKYEGSVMEVNESIFNLNSDEFASLAKKDGAIILSREGIVLKAGAKPKAKKFIPLTETLETLLKKGIKGTRHTGGAEVCCACRDVLVIVISSQRGMCIMYDGEPIEWDF